MDLSADSTTFPTTEDDYIPNNALSYDDTVPYEDQLPPPKQPSRIKTNKLYLLSDTLAEAGRGTTASTKRKRHDEGEPGMDYVEDVEMNGDDSLRPNALLLRGPPIAHLPTARIFAYVTHFDVHPKGLEWVDDTTCIIVFNSAALCKSAHRSLTKSPTEEPDDDECITAKPIPIDLWPPEERINKTLGVGEGLKGKIRMRTARNGDVKKRGARKESQFYKKHGLPDGEEHVSDGDSRKRSRRDGDMDDEEKRRLLDAELDNFLARDSDDEANSPTDGSRKRTRGSGRTDSSANGRASSPPSKMRSDYILDAENKRSSRPRSLLERTSIMRAHPDDLEMERGWGSETHSREDRPIRPLPRRRRDEAPRTNERPKKTQQELDDELDAFLKERPS